MIRTQPQDVSAAPGEKVKLKAGAAGKDLSYQWYYRTSSADKWKKATSITGTRATYTFTATEAKNGYEYRCLVKNPYGKVYTDPVRLTVE